MNPEKYSLVVAAVKQYMDENKYRRPTIAEICHMTGIKSVSQVLGLLMIAVEKGDLIEEGARFEARRFAAPMEGQA